MGKTTFKKSSPSKNASSSLSKRSGIKKTKSTKQDAVVKEGPKSKWEWEVKAVTDSKKDRHGQLTYKVEWVGWPGHTWEPAKNLKNAPDVVEDFHEANPDKPAPE